MCLYSTRSPSSSPPSAAFIPAVSLLAPLRRHRNFITPIPPTSAPLPSTRRVLQAVASPSPSPESPVPPPDDDTVPETIDDSPDNTTDSASSPEDVFSTAQTNLASALNTAFDTFFNPLRAACPVLTSSWTPSYGNYILHPTTTSPKAVLHFVGGAFFGAVPHQLYNTLLTRLAARGHVVVATPYDLSFDYLPIADTVAQRWQAVEADLASRYGPLPVIGVGHSAGALFHALAAALFDDVAPKAANILISFNCRSVQSAIPGYDVLLPIAKTTVALEKSLPSQVRSSLKQFPSRLDAAIADATLTPTALKTDVLPAAQQARRFVEQVWPVLRELAGESRDSDMEGDNDDENVVDDGEETTDMDVENDSSTTTSRETSSNWTSSSTSNSRNSNDAPRDFYPPVDEICAAVERLYPVGETLVVRFRDDTLDDSDRLVDVLRRKQDVRFSVMELDGTHLTPLAQDGPDLAAAAAAAAATGMGGPFAESVASVAGGVIGEVVDALGLRQLQALEAVIDEWVDAAIANDEI